MYTHKLNTQSLNIPVTTFIRIICEHFTLNTLSYPMAAANIEYDLD